MRTGNQSGATRAHSFNHQTSNSQLRTILAVLLLLPLAAPLRAEDATTAPTNPLPGKPNVRLPLADVPQLPAAPLKLDDLNARYPAFQHEPFATAGFDALVLPFHYVDTAHAGNPDEANAFAFLLSLSLDWAPGSYANRHAYFTFKGSPDETRALLKAYHHETIGTLIHAWEATHAVGGEIVRDPAGKGYTGSIEIFTPNGRTTFRKSFDEPRPYFTLLGDATVEAMRFFGYPATPALTDYLRRPRCAHFESIPLLGSAAFMESRSAQELAVYTKILDADPTFGEVRYWWANQRRWAEPQWIAESNVQKGIAARDSLLPAALNDFQPRTCKDVALRNAYPQWLDKAHELLGADHPDDLRYRLHLTQAHHEWDLDLFDRALHTASRFPNSYWLDYDLARVYLDPAGPADCDLTASLSLAASQSRFLPAVTSRSKALYNMGFACRGLGDDDVTAALFADTAKDPRTGGDVAWSRVMLARSLFNSARWADVIQLYDALSAANPRIDAVPIDRAQIATYAGVAAALLNQPDRLHAIRQAHAQALAQFHTDKLLDLYADLLAGKSTDVGIALPQSPARQEWSDWQWCLLQAQADLLNHKAQVLPSLQQLIWAFPNERLGYVMLDLYAQQSHPAAYTATDPIPALYTTAAFLRPDDPWTKAALARIGRPPEFTAADLQSVLDRVKDCPTDRWFAPAQSAALAAADRHNRPMPFEVAAAVHELLAHDQRPAAHDLACRYRSLMVAYRMVGAKVFSNHLIHLTEAPPAAKPAQ